jgi:hypothetical protein
MEVFLDGGGTCGFAAMVRLYEMGVKSRICEANHEHAMIVRGIYRPVQAIMQFAMLGLEAMLEGQGAAVQKKGFFTSQGQIIIRKPMGRLAGNAVGWRGV